MVPYDGDEAGRQEILVSRGLPANPSHELHSEGM